MTFTLVLNDRWKIIKMMTKFLFIKRTNIFVTFQYFSILSNQSTSLCVLFQLVLISQFVSQGIKMCLHLKLTMLRVEKYEFVDFVINSLAYEQSQLFQLLLSYHFNIPLM